MLNPGSSQVLRRFYKAIHTLLNKTDCTWAALVAVHQRDARGRGAGELGDISL